MTQPHLCLLGDATSVHVSRWCEEMRARGFRVSVITARPAPIDGVEPRVLRPVVRSIDWLRRVAETRRHLVELAPDIVHAHYITSYGYLAARAVRHPLVMTAWGSDILVTPQRHALLRMLTGWTLRRADALTGDSLDLVAALASYCPRAVPRQIHWGVDMAKFQPSAWGDKPACDIVSLRSWEPNYRIDAIVDAVAQRVRHAGQLPTSPQIHLHLLGGGSGEAALRTQVRALEIDAHVTFHGRVDEVAMVAVLRRCKASVSVPLSDATSVSVLESMACGLAVVASDLPANRQWLGARGSAGGDGGRHGAAAGTGTKSDNSVAHCDGGWLVADAGTGLATLVDALADAFAALQRDDARCQAVGLRNFQHMVAEGSRSVQMDAMASWYRELLSGTPHRSVTTQAPKR